MKTIIKILYAMIIISIMILILTITTYSTILIISEIIKTIIG